MFIMLLLGISWRNSLSYYLRIVLCYILKCKSEEFIMQIILQDKIVHNCLSMGLKTLELYMLVHKDLFDCQRIYFM